MLNKNAVAGWVGLLCIAFGAQAADSTSAGCDRACLKGFTDQYFDALAKNDASKLPVARTVKFTENGETLKLGEGFWKTAGATTSRMEIFDPEEGGAAVQAVLHSKEKDDLVIFLLRLKVQEMKISEVETIVARKGVASGALWGPDNLKGPTPAFSQSIRPAEQNSRLELMAAADGYWRAFSTNGSPDYHPAPFLPDTARYENGVRTTNVSFGKSPPSTAAQQFDSGMFKVMNIYDRRYPVVDVERGVVLSIVRFGRREPVPGGDIPLVSEFFAVKAGKIQEITTVMTNRPGNSPTGW